MRALAAVCVLLLVGSAGTAHAAPVPVMLLPFGEDDEERKKLFDAIELELELSEEVVMSPGAALFEELGTRDLNERGDEQIADKLTMLEQQALIYPVFPEDKTRAVIVLFRVETAQVVYAEEVVIQDAAWKPREQVVEPVLAVVRELGAAEPVSEERLVELGVRGDAAPVDPAEAGDGAAQDETEATGEGDTKDAGEGGASTDDEEAEVVAADGARPPGADGIGRVALSYAPTLLQYRACNPGPTVPTPFLCQPGVASDVTEVLVNPLASPVGFAASAEAFALGIVGLELDANVYYARLEVTDANGLLQGFEPNPFSVFGGTLTAAGALRGSFGFGIIGLSVGARAGYNLSFALTDDTRFGGGDGNNIFTVLPSWYSHRGLVGAELLLGIGPWARLYSNVDLLFGYHGEGLTQVGANPLGFGGRATAGVDVDLFAGAFLRAGLDAQAFNVNTTGVADAAQARQTFAGTTFSDGQVRILEMRGVLGVGYHY